MNLCIIQPWYTSVSETFIRAHAERLPAKVTAVHGRPPQVGDRPILTSAFRDRVSRFIDLEVTRKSSDPIEYAYYRILRETKADAVLAEYGLAGVQVMTVCERLNLPFIVHFHGYDACRHDVLREYGDAYRTMFRRASAIVAVSRDMRAQLISLGAPAERVFLNHYGVDCDAFTAASPQDAAPVFLAVGRFVPKKAPHLLLLAFADVHESYPEARLRLIGDGPLLEICRDLAHALRIDDAVDFLGAQPHEVVQKEMSRARAFVQHSVISADGDREGTPNAILEAGASALPVVSTVHAGIPDVVVHGKTGLLVPERDTVGMAQAMMRLVAEPETAAKLGAAARAHITAHFSMEASIDRLWTIVESCVRGGAPPPLDILPEPTAEKAPRSAPNRSAFVTQD